VLIRIYIVHSQYRKGTLLCKIERKENKQQLINGLRRKIFLIFLKSLLTLPLVKSNLFSVSSLALHRPDTLSSFSGAHDFGENGGHYDLKPCWCFQFHQTSSRCRNNLLRLSHLHDLNVVLICLMKVCLCNYYQ
jgi:hypothetical protein